MLVFGSVIQKNMWLKCFWLLSNILFYFFVIVDVAVTA